MAEIDKELARLKKERKELEHAVLVKKEIAENLKELKRDQRMLKEADADLHPTKSRKLKKAIGVLFQGLREAAHERREKRRKLMAEYRAKEQHEIHAAHATHKKLKEMS